MKLIITTIILGLTFGLNAQIDDESEKNNLIWLSVDLTYGNMLYNHRFNQQINSFEYSKVFNPIQTIGISFTQLVERNKTFDISNFETTYISYTQVIPQRFEINDSITGRINGGNFGMNIFSYNFELKPYKFYLFTGIGFKTGRLRISSPEYRAMVNPYFAPMIIIQPLIRFGPLAITLRGEYLFDVTKKDWKSVKLSKKSNLMEINEFRQTGLNISLCIGLILR